MPRAAAYRDARPGLAGLCALLLCLLAGGAQAAGSRVALLIGNARYADASFDLANPVNDVEALGDRLGAMGFAVTRAENSDRDTMRRALSAFAAAAKGAEIALFFYAGHGVQAKGENFLLGSNLSSVTREGLEAAAITLSEIRQVFARAGPELGIVILDACRNNPFTESALDFIDGKGLTRSAGAAGMLIAYSTDPGSVAYDGKGANSIFTSALLQHIGTPGLDVRLMFGRVRQEVVLATEGRQVPWVEESVLGEHYLNTETTREDLARQVNRDVARWREVSGSLEPGPYRAYLQEFPDGLFRDFAERRLARFAQASTHRVEGAEEKFDLVTFISQVNPRKLTDSLELLGYLPRTGGVADRVQLRRGLEAYIAESDDPESFSPQKMFLEAARINVFLGTKLAQRIRTDIVALSAIDTAMKVAQDTYAEIERIARTDPSAKALLPDAKAQLDAIAEAQFKVLGRLDQSREYYNELLRTAGDDFGDLMTPALLGLDGNSRQLGEVSADAERDIRLFLKHARIASNEATRGTLTWLSDFLPAE
ncbi:MAG: caspase family protein [Alphaproteobacteria bacterium]|nr:MAG: caspase family protein [Alphaproteobacteria bacterium]